MTEVDRFADGNRWGSVRADGPDIWRTLGYRRVDQDDGGATVEWDATDAYCFPSPGGPIVQGGMVTALLDAAMGGACWSVLDPGQAFLTADLRVEFLRSCRPGTLRAVGGIVQRTRRVVFCSAELSGPDGVVLAASRCTQVVLPADSIGRSHPSPP